MALALSAALGGRTPSRSGSPRDHRRRRPWRPRPSQRGAARRPSRRRPGQPLPPRGTRPSAAAHPWTAAR
eukprot:5935303-Alexandrium_andersonii.AAC.1